MIGACGEIRTRNIFRLKETPLPVGLRKHGSDLAHFPLITGTA